MWTRWRHSWIVRGRLWALINAWEAGTVVRTFSCSQCTVHGNRSLATCAGFTSNWLSGSLEHYFPQYGCRSFYNVYANNTQLASHFHILHHDEKSPQKPLMSVAQVALTCQLKVFLAKTPQLEALALSIPVRTA